MSEFQGRQALLADVVTGSIVAALGVATIVLAAQMPTFAERGSNPLTAPGIFPALVGFCFVVSGLILVLRSGKRLRTVGDDRAGSQPPVPLRVLGGFVLMLAAVTLVGRVDIRIVMAAFSLVFCAFFVQWDRERLARQLAGVAVATAFAALLIPMAFEELFLVRMP